MASIDGKWNVTINTQMGAQNVVLDITTSGNSLSGTMAGPQGSMDIKDGTVDGDTAKWKAELTQPMAITLEVSAKVDGDSISGDVALGAFGNATFSGTRA